MKKKWLSFFIILTVTMAFFYGCGSKADEKETNVYKEQNTDTEDGFTEESAKEDKGKKSTDGLVIRSSLFPTPAYDNQIYLAKVKGFLDEEFAKDNIKIELIEFANGPAANEALIAGEIDIAHAIGDQPMITGIAAGSNAKALTTLSRQTSTQGVYIRSDSSISKVEDLKGKKIAVGIGTFTHKCVVGILEEYGIKEDEVELINFPLTTESIAALVKGDIDALVGNFSNTYEYVKDGTIKQLVDFTTYPAYTFLVVGNHIIEKYPEVTQRLVNVIVKTQNWADENPEEAARIVADYTGQSYEAVYELRSQVDFKLGITEEDIKQLEYTYNFLKDHDYLSNELNDLSILYDDSFINKALKEQNAR
ncbi:MAG: hypothetical protein ACFWTJ_00685 [Lachnoclostridium sp.]|jgi:sulfonate transport system substrate-binding protein